MKYHVFDFVCLLTNTSLRLRGALVAASLFLWSCVFKSDIAIRQVETNLQTGTKIMSCYATLIVEGKKYNSLLRKTWV